MLEKEVIWTVQLVYSSCGIIKAAKGEYSKENLGNAYFMKKTEGVGLIWEGMHPPFRKGTWESLQVWE